VVAEGRWWRRRRTTCGTTPITATPTTPLAVAVDVSVFVDVRVAHGVRLAGVAPEHARPISAAKGGLLQASAAVPQSIQPQCERLLPAGCYCYCCLNFRLEADHDDAIVFNYYCLRRRRRRCCHQVDKNVAEQRVKQ